MDGHITKIYVESPIFSHEDEELYRYVNPDLDDEFGDYRMESVGTFRHIEPRNRHDKGRMSQDEIVSDRYEDMDQFSAKDSPQKPESFYLHAPSTTKHSSIVPVPAPARAEQIYRELKEEVEEERRETERRNQNQRRQARKNNIPQLDLVDSEDEEKMKRHGFMDLEIIEGGNSGPNETAAEVAWAANQKHLFTKGRGANSGKADEAPRHHHQKPVRVREFPAERHSAPQFQQPLPPIIHDPVQRYLPPNKVVNALPHEQSAPRGYQPYHPYMIPNDSSAEYQSGFVNPVRQNDGSWPVEHKPPMFYQRRTGSEGNIVKAMPASDPHGKAKDYIKANKQEAMKKEKSKKTYGEMFSNRKKKDNVEIDSSQRGHSEEIKMRGPGGDVSRVPGDFGQPLPVNMIQTYNMTHAPMPAHVVQALPTHPAQPLPANMPHQMPIHVNHPVPGYMAQPTQPYLDHMAQPVPNYIPYPNQPVMGYAAQPPWPRPGNAAHPVPTAANHQFPGSYSMPQQIDLNHGMMLNHAGNQQGISIPIQVPGIAAEDQQNVSVNINLRLLNQDVDAVPQLNQNNAVANNVLNNGMSTTAGKPMANRRPAKQQNVGPPAGINSYSLLPPVGGSGLNQTSHVKNMLSAAENDPQPSPKGGYLEHLRRNQKPPQYKEYTINDYRRMKKEIKTMNLGKLGPDLENEERLERQVKDKRKQTYSRKVKERNQVELALRSRRDSNSEDPASHEDSLDKRRIALEYAKTIKKPKIVRDRKENFANHDSSRKADSDFDLLADEFEEIRLLKERHELERKQLELIERGVKMILPQNA